MVNGWFIFFGLLWAYVIFLFWLMRSGRMEKYNLSLLLGFIIMVRTRRGRGILDAVARPRRLWNLFGDTGIVVTLIGMAAMTFLMLALVPVVLNPSSGVQPLGASEILVIPGVNPFVPLWYGIAALIITLVVHEGGHGVLARANGLKVKSMGLLYAIVPVGAFVEPDEEELQAAPRRQRLRVFAAGAFVNLVVSAVILAAFSGMVAAADPIPGAPISQVTAGAPAEVAGIGPGDLLTSADGTPLADWDAFQDYMDTRHPGDQVTFQRHDATAVTVTLGNRWDHQLQSDAERQAILDAAPDQKSSGQGFCDAVLGTGAWSDGHDCAEQLQNAPFLGVGAFPRDAVQGALGHPIKNAGTSWGLLLTLPINEVRGTPILSTMDAFYETPFDGSAYWPLVTLLFWVFWINLMVGLTNILPLLPLDGGHIFRDAVGGMAQRLRPNMDPERRDRIVGRMAGTMSIIILVAFLLQIFGPRIAGAFATG